ncbi:hypothetical protein RIB2604_01708010 [Aspergillus luchuensis]|uniref:Uncharacterized protein n=1 Tax=Aspergillus kawachii TaxID=1069201 RepID=A0A146FDG2_ASPKA|nr:hypothetical protein RIB2604_01708010 [Aspergillus luchuensis]
MSNEMPIVDLFQSHPVAEEETYKEDDKKQEQANE